MAVIFKNILHKIPVHRYILLGLILFSINKSYCSPFISPSDSIIIQNKTFSARVFVLSQYCSENRLMERNFLKYEQLCAYDSYAIWEIIDSALYLKKVIDYNKNEELNLKEFFGEYYVKGLIKAKWYNGHIKIPVKAGKNSSNKELFITIINGDLISLQNIDKDNLSVPIGYKRMSNWIYSLIIPDNFYRHSLTTDFRLHAIENDYPNTSPVFIGSSDSVYFIGCYTQFNDTILLKHNRTSKIIKRLDQFKEMYSEFNYNENSIKDYKYGTIAFSDGINRHSLIRLIIMANHNMTLTIVFAGKRESDKKFKEFSIVILENIFIAESMY